MACPNAWSSHCIGHARHKPSPFSSSSRHSRTHQTEHDQSNSQNRDKQFLMYDSRNHKNIGRGLRRTLGSAMRVDVDFLRSRDFGKRALNGFRKYFAANYLRVDFFECTKEFRMWKKKSGSIISNLIRLSMGNSNNYFNFSEIFKGA